MFFNRFYRQIRFRKIAAVWALSAVILWGPIASGVEDISSGIGKADQEVNESSQGKTNAPESISFPFDQGLAGNRDGFSETDRCRRSIVEVLLPTLQFAGLVSLQNNEEVLSETGASQFYEFQCVSRLWVSLVVSRGPPLPAQ